MPRPGPNSYKRPKEIWPKWFYGPNGEAEIFKSAADVPWGWVAKPGLKFEEPKQPPVLDREELIQKLKEKKIEALATWSARYMKELLDNDSRPSR